MKLAYQRIAWVQLLQLVVAAVLLSGGIVAGYGTVVRPGPGQIVVVSHPAHKAVPPYTFPNGGRTLFPNYRLIALYGSPDEPLLGALGQQPVDAAVQRTKALATQYQPLMSEHALPTMEIIATVASADPTANNDYSRDIDISKLQLWVSAARQNGVYVVLDLQSGRSSFLAQAEEYQPLLEQPNVGLALDPEWRLTATEVPLAQIGTVDISEINQTADWLANLTKKDKLPQKLFLLHEFQLSMLPGRSQLDTSHPELSYAIQMDGQGTQAEKLDTWSAVTADPPPNVYFGWKNFYAKDSPLRSPQDTMLLTPKPWYVSYQ